MNPLDLLKKITFPPVPETLFIERLSPKLALHWTSVGWVLIRRHPFVWMGLALLASMLLWGSALLLHSYFAAQCLMPFLLAAFLGVCQLDEEGQSLDFYSLLSPLGTHAKPLFIMGALGLGGECLIAGLLMILFLILGGTLAVSAFFDSAQSALALLISRGFLWGGMFIILTGTFLLGALLMGLWFAVPLILFRHYPILLAVSVSFQGCWANVGGLLFQNALMAALFIPVMATFGLGGVVWLPLCLASYYVSYRAIFRDRLVLEEAV